jgi:hypothetical protein
MKTALYATLGTTLLVAATACGPTAQPGPGSALAQATIAVVAPAASPTADAMASPSPALAERVDGAVQTFANGQVTLSNGRSFAAPASASITLSRPSAATDLHTGDYVAITGKIQGDGTLLATIVNVFAPSRGQIAPGQRPLPSGDLMTNATVQDAEGDTFTAMFPGGSATVHVAPDARVTRSLDATLDDLHVGDTVMAQVRDNVALSLTIQPSGSAKPTS